MPQVLLIYDDQRLLPKQIELDQIELQYGFEVYQYPIRESPVSFPEFFATITERRMRLLWVVLLYSHPTKSQDLEEALSGHTGSPFLIPLLLGTDQVGLIFSKAFQRWWKEQWRIVLRQSGPSFEQFWQVPGVPVGIISSPFKPARDFDGYLFPWLKRWDADLEAARTFETMRELPQMKGVSRRGINTASRKVRLAWISLIAGAVVVSILSSSLDRLIEAALILAALALAIGALLLARNVFSPPRGIPVTHERSALFRILTSFLVFLLLGISGALMLATYGRFTETVPYAVITTLTPVSTALTQPSASPATSPAPVFSRATVTPINTPIPSPSGTWTKTSTSTATTSKTQASTPATSTYPGIAPTNTSRPTVTSDFLTRRE